VYNVSQTKRRGPLMHGTRVLRHDTRLMRMQGACLKQGAGLMPTHVTALMMMVHCTLRLAPVAVASRRLFLLPPAPTLAIKLHSRVLSLGGLWYSIHGESAVHSRMSMHVAIEWRARSDLNEHM
jgi:hypothetical protein